MSLFIYLDSLNVFVVDVRREECHVHTSSFQVDAGRPLTATSPVEMGIGNHGRYSC